MGFMDNRLPDCIVDRPAGAAWQIVILLIRNCCSDHEQNIQGFSACILKLFLHVYVLSRFLGFKMIQYLDLLDAKERSFPLNDSRSQDGHNYKN